jgi:hypothetical protein
MNKSIHFILHPSALKHISDSDSAAFIINRRMKAALFFVVNLVEMRREAAVRASLTAASLFTFE